MVVVASFGCIDRNSQFSKQICRLKNHLRFTKLVVFYGGFHHHPPSVGMYTILNIFQKKKYRFETNKTSAATWHILTIFHGFSHRPTAVFRWKIHLSDKSRTLASDNLAHRLETFDISRLRRPIWVPFHGDPGVILGWAVLVGKRWWWVTRKPVNTHFCTWCWGWRKYFGGAIHLSCRYYKVRWTCCVKLS